METVTVIREKPDSIHVAELPKLFLREISSGCLLGL